MGFLIMTFGHHLLRSLSSYDGMTVKRSFLLSLSIFYRQINSVVFAVMLSYPLFSSI